jgi:hypothetical protein
MKMQASSHRIVFLTQFIVATGLVVLSVAVVALWALLAAFALNHVLEPWSNAGILLFGLGFIALAAVPGIPGVLWTRQLANRLGSRWAKLARISGAIGTIALSIGGVAALGLLVWAVNVGGRDASPPCVSYRDEAASAALASSGARDGLPDCPAR